jgi:hypothetical protein
MKILLFIRTIILLTLLCFLSVPILADEEVPGSGFSIRVAIDRGVISDAEPGTNNTPPTGTGNITVKIVDIKNITGHNPLNPDNPVLNNNGQVFDTPEDLKDCVANNNCTTTNTGGGYNSGNIFGGCGASKTLGATLNGGLVLYKDGNTGNCEIKLKISVRDPDPAAPAGMTEGFRVENPEVGNQAAGTVLLKTAPGSGFFISSPPAGATPLTGSSWAVIPGTYTIVLQHIPTGNDWQYGLNIIGQPPAWTDPVPPKKNYNFTKVGWLITTREEL